MSQESSQGRVPPESKNQNRIAAGKAHAIEEPLKTSWKSSKIGMGKASRLIDFQGVKISARLTNSVDSFDKFAFRLKFAGTWFKNDLYDIRKIL
jgi:hypothetical protein